MKELYRSIDEGVTWVRINDDQHEFVGPGNGQFVMGDQNILGRVYMSTAGRGVVYGEIDEEVVTCTPVSIDLQLQANEGSWEQTESVFLDGGDMIRFDALLSAERNWTWSWSGPQGFGGTSPTFALVDSFLL